MKIQILDNAKLDLVDGFHFYESQEDGVGHYFLDCLYSDIDFSYYMLEFTRGNLMIFIGCFPGVFHMQFTILMKTK